jgi:hypothetical protein
VAFRSVSRMPPNEPMGRRPRVNREAPLADGFA